MGDPYEQRAGAAELGDTDLADQQADVTLAVIGEVTGRFAGLDRVVNVLGDPVVVRLCAHGAQAGEDARPVLAQGGGENEAEVDHVPVKLRCSTHVHGSPTSVLRLDRKSTRLNSSR